MRSWWFVFACGMLGHAVPARAGAQERLPADGGITTSLGQPGQWLWTFGASTGLGRRHGEFSGLAEGRAGVYRELLNPVLGFGGLQLEGYGGAFDTRVNAGARLRFVSPVSGIALGADYNATAGTVRPMLTYVHPVRRGGISGNGSVLRLDIMPGRDRTLMIGVEKPVFRRIPVGSNRPKRDKVRLRSRAVPDAPIPASPADLRASIDVARDAALAVGRLTVPWLDHRGTGGSASNAAILARLDTLERFLTGVNGAGTRSLEVETRRLHDAMDRAFSLAIDPGDSARTGASAAGQAAGRRAREIVLREVLFPYNRHLGQIKEEDTTRGFAVLARGAFLRWLLAEARMPRAPAEVSLAVFSEYLEITEQVRASTRHDWKDSRFVWLPLQLALLPDQHDSQEELDALIAAATEEEFTDGNDASWIINDQFQYQLSRTIREARDYHVLLTHDFRGYNAEGKPDEMSFRHVLHSYLAALTARVRAYDSTGTFPVYMILIDEWFYQVNHGRLWMNLLQDPVRYSLRLGPGSRALEDSLRAAQDSLRAAIDASTLLSVQRRQYGEEWLRRMVKVHVNVTNSADPSFWSWRVARHFPMPDAWMRDHRKIVFYDLDEEDPCRGEAIFTGAGIGEHYANASWEDRSLLVRGPAVLGLKAAARDVLLQQGIPNTRMPVVLQVRTPRNGDEGPARCTVGRNTRPLRALQLHNRTGFDAKQVNVGKAVLYTLMPPGSVITVPDGLWNGAFWGSALVGAALRGARVLIIAPSLASAPARAFGSMVRGRELLWRMLAASRTLGPEITAAGGTLRVGVFASSLPVTDVAGKARAVSRTLAQHPWLRDLLAFPPEVYPGLERNAATLDSLSRARQGVSGTDSTPGSLLHLKANFFASREAWTIFARPDWASLMEEFAQLRLAQAQRPSAAVARFEEAPNALRDVGNDVLQRWYDDLAPHVRDRVVFFSVIGSANQNERSFTLDGEVALVISRWPNVIAYLDLVSLVGQSTWIEDPSQLDAFLPMDSSLKRRLAHWFKLAF